MDAASNQVRIKVDDEELRRGKEQSAVRDVIEYLFSFDFYRHRQAFAPAAVALAVLANTRPPRPFSFLRRPRRAQTVPEPPAPATPPRPSAPGPPPPSQPTILPPTTPMVSEPDSAPTKASLKAWWTHFTTAQKMKRDAEQRQGPSPARRRARTEPRSPRSPAQDEHPVFGKPLRESLRYASVQISTANANGELYVWGCIPVVVAKCGLYLKENGARLSLHLFPIA